MKQQAMKKSAQKILIADHTKFNQIKPAFISELTLFDQIITDKLPDEKFVSFFNENNISLIY